MRIVVAPEARDELAAAVGYIAKDNPVAAARFKEEAGAPEPHAVVQISGSPGDPTWPKERAPTARATGARSRATPAAGGR